MSSPLENAPEMFSSMPMLCCVAIVTHADGTKQVVELHCSENAFALEAQIRATLKREVNAEALAVAKSINVYDFIGTVVPDNIEIGLLSASARIYGPAGYSPEALNNARKQLGLAR